MKSFNESVEALENRGTELSPSTDTDSDVGSFGKTEGEAPEAPEGDKLVLYVDGGIEIHIPTDVFQQMSDAMLGNGGLEAGPEASEAPEADEEKEESPCDDDNRKDCPFEKKDDTEDKSDEDDSDKDKKDEE